MARNSTATEFHLFFPRTHHTGAQVPFMSRHSNRLLGATGAEMHRRRRAVSVSKAMLSGEVCPVRNRTTSGNRSCRRPRTNPHDHGATGGTWRNGGRSDFCVCKIKQRIAAMPSLPYARTRRHNCKAAPRPRRALPIPKCSGRRPSSL